jgi:hypothetical protein
MPVTRNTIAVAITVGIIVFSSAAGQDIKRIFTLSDEALMSLDVYQYGNPEGDPNLPRVIARRNIDGPGVEFDIYFPGDNERKDNNAIMYVSCIDRGKETLTHADVNGFDAFALKFTLVAVDGKSEVNAGGMLVVGAFINGAYRPECISFNQGDEAISTTMNGARKIHEIGFDVHKLSPEGWSPEGNTVTIRIEAAPDAEML